VSSKNRRKYTSPGVISTDYNLHLRVALTINFHPHRELRGRLSFSLEDSR
jgi:hypothetical protein